MLCIVSLGLNILQFDKVGKKYKMLAVVVGFQHLFAVITAYRQGKAFWLYLLQCS